MDLIDNNIDNVISTDSAKIGDDSLKENAEFAGRAGLEVRVTRVYDGVGLSDDRQCEWCLSRCGTNMTLEEAYEKGAFERHPGCGCEISYTSEKGITRTQSWSGGRESWVQEDAIEKRKSIGDNKGPSRKEMVKRMLRGQQDPNNGGIIAEKILNKEVSLQQRHQKYLQHVEGSPQYISACKGRGRLQSYLTISEDEAQKIIYNCAGKGIMSNSNDIREYITLDRVIGEYYEGGQWHKTKRVMIMYRESGAHIVPVKEL